MSQWHREHPELTGTGAGPWMANESYRRIVERMPLESDHDEAPGGAVRLAVRQRELTETEGDHDGA